MPIRKNSIQTQIITAVTVAVFVYVAGSLLAGESKTGSVHRLQYMQRFLHLFARSHDAVQAGMHALLPPVPVYVRDTGPSAPWPHA
ncbi:MULTISPECIES: hypothetical protein [Burkholderia]|uniref:hypothetical protein n=1 Tax=Burkholderia TaxID=32008 RepID=UPI001CF4DF1A|nr:MULTISPECIES: hypothetical protein [Burkholderia]MCA8037233.1 hypothetical protein [Burkholderia arboris]MDN7702646.1 hypothetical protein [Burkholderia sp. AU44665]